MIFYVDAFAGLGFVWLYLSGKIKAFDKRGHVSKLCIVFLPLLVASLVGISRVSDYRHHWQDVFVGGILGLCFYTSPSLSLSSPSCFCWNLVYGSKARLFVNSSVSMIHVLLFDLSETAIVEILMLSY